MRHISHGADVEQLDDIAVALRRRAEEVAAAGDRGSALLERLRALWDGPDFERFAKEWRAAHRRIDDAEAALRGYSRALVAEAESQRSTSGRPGAGGAGGGGAASGRGGGLAVERGDRVAPTSPGHPLGVPPGLVRDGEVIASEAPGVPARPAFERLAFELLDPPADHGHGAFLRSDLAFDPRPLAERGLPAGATDSGDGAGPGEWLPTRP